MKSNKCVPVFFNDSVFAMIDFFRRAVEEEKGQTSLEYLLTISVAIMLAALVFALTLQTKVIVDNVVKKIRAYRVNAILSSGG